MNGGLLCGPLRLRCVAAMETSAQSCCLDLVEPQNDESHEQGATVASFSRVAPLRFDQVSRRSKSLPPSHVQVHCDDDSSQDSRSDSKDSALSSLDEHSSQASCVYVRLKHDARPGQTLLVVLLELSIFLLPAADAPPGI